MDYRAVAQEIYDKVGQKENIVSAAHCATRLRLVLADNDKVDAVAVEDVDGVSGVFSASGQLQVILGTGTVNKVYDEFIDIAGITGATKEEAKAAANANTNIFKRAIKTLGDVFVPIIPAIVASGFLMGIMEALNFMVNNNILSIDTSGSVYVFANLFANTAYVFLPILIGFSAARAFGGNPYLGAVIGGLMIHPDLQNAWTVATEGVLKTQSVWFGLYEIDLIGYQGHVIPVIIAVFVMSFIEKKLHKVVPPMFDLFVTPLVSVFVTGYLTSSIIGPVFVYIENGIISGILWLLTLPFGIGSLIMGGLYSTTVVAGIHHMYTVIDIGQLAQYGVTYWLPLASAANMGQGAATLAVGLKTRNQKMKSIALPSSLSCFMGITEPAIFGVNLRYLKPFVCGAIGGAAGAMYASIVSLGATGTGVTGIFGILLCLNNPFNYIMTCLISAGVAFGLTWAFGYSNADEQDNSNSKKKEKPEVEPIVEISIEAEPNKVYAPVEGEVINFDQIPDETFASGVLGPGVGINPTSETVVAPFDGEITVVPDTKHAIGLIDTNGNELLIHVGVDTVTMNGDGFNTFVEVGDKVKAGQKLLSFDKEKIKDAGFSDCVVVLVTNQSDKDNLKIETGNHKSLDEIIEIIK